MTTTYGLNLILISQLHDLNAFDKINLKLVYHVV